MHKRYQRMIYVTTKEVFQIIQVRGPTHMYLCCSCTLSKITKSPGFQLTAWINGAFAAGPCRSGYTRLIILSMTRIMMRWVFKSSCTSLTPLTSSVSMNSLDSSNVKLFHEQEVVSYSCISSRQSACTTTCSRPVTSLWTRACWNKSLHSAALLPSNSVMLLWLSFGPCKILGKL